MADKCRMKDIANEMVANHLIEVEEMTLTNTIEQLHSSFEKEHLESDTTGIRLEDYTYAMLAMLFAPFDPESKSN